ncbi:hypothetical protein PVL29_024664 [Vitis rotundifolia]|uniref:DUF4283 domain-containing protein n=1 Tax=Vitis rotundifolia TaxID=103349 RepID=A0AA38YSQ0_VITRO|nr:hypothetical protein PVL29_024664 [Vitis rotundifolia]
MVETLRCLGCADRGMNSQKEDEPRSKPTMAKTYAEVTNMARGKERAAVRVEVTKEEVGRNLIKLDHCVIGTWNPNAAKGDDLRGWGIQLARTWSLKGNLGLAKMERGKVLMEFELLTEAEQAFKLGSISVGGIFLRLEKWRSETGCLREGEKSSEAWVRVVGLPVSLWERDILRRIGEACGGFLAVDYQTETMEELQWARLLVKRNGEALPNAVEVWIEELCYSVTLWWEVRPVMKVTTTGKRVPTTGERGKTVAMGEEVRGETSTRASERVNEAMEGSRLEAILLTADGTRGQSSGSGQSRDLTWSDDGLPGGPHVSGGLALLGQTKPSRWTKAAESSGRAPFGPVDPGIWKPTERAKSAGLLQRDGLDNQNPFSLFRAQPEEGLSAAECGRSPMRSPDAAISPFWAKDGL